MIIFSVYLPYPEAVKLTSSVTLAHCFKSHSVTAYPRRQQTLASNIFVISNMRNGYDTDKKEKRKLGQDLISKILALL
jgi:hypothetical protein